MVEEPSSQTMIRLEHIVYVSGPEIPCGQGELLSCKGSLGRPSVCQRLARFVAFVVCYLLMINYLFTNGLICSINGLYLFYKRFVLNKRFVIFYY